MKTIVHVELDDTQLRAVAAALGKAGKATRKDVKVFAESVMRIAVAAAPTTRKRGSDRQMRSAEEAVVTAVQAGIGCTSLDHIYPADIAGTHCYCRKRVWGERPSPSTAIALNELTAEI